MSMAHRDFPEDDDDGDHSQPNYALMLTTTLILASMPVLQPGHLAALLKELDSLLEDRYNMSGPDIMAAIADLPVPQEGFVDGMAFQDAVEVRRYHILMS